MPQDSCFSYTRRYGDTLDNGDAVQDLKPLIADDSAFTQDHRIASMTLCTDKRSGSLVGLQTRLGVPNPEQSSYEQRIPLNKIGKVEKSSTVSCDNFKLDPSSGDYITKLTMRYKAAYPDSIEYVGVETSEGRAFGRGIFDPEN